MARCRLLLVVLLAGCCFLTAVQGACPSKCSRHGTCGSDNTCTCFPGYTGYDCNGRACPTRDPWVDFATDKDSVRSVPQECSNRGHCNRGNGRCECDAGFAGVACERLQLCRTNCNGHGKCTSMRAMAATKNDYNLLYSATYDTPWDADRIYGCVCDHGYTGVDCSLRQCPYGDDPISTGQADEVQAVSCLCNGCTGTFTLSFRGETTRLLDGSVDTAATLETALEELITVRGVSVTLDGGTTLCDSDGGTSLLTVEKDGTRAAYGSTPFTVRGTKEWLECSGRGNCNTLIGLCACAPGFGPSDGLGGSGSILDCGYYSGSGLTTCAGIPGAVTRCYNHGRCLGASLYRCLCDEGAQMRVSVIVQVLADAFLASKEQHATECRVQPVTGPCATTEGLAGHFESWQLSPQRPRTPPLASSTDRTQTHWQRGMLTWSKAATATRFRSTVGRACATQDTAAPKPHARAVMIPGQLAKQTKCKPADCCSEVWITSVSVAYSTGTAACGSAGNDIAVTFHSPSGDLPLLSISASSLTHSTAAVATSIVQTTQGTKEDVVCNNRGRCDEDTGTCVCSLYHASGNARGGFGALDDCGAVDAFMTHGEL
ncbi:hypothetical protein KRP22_013727 [Phytophthora ramorum]|nr:Tenascin-X [Phytophthora ramorum]